MDKEIWVLRWAIIGGDRYIGEVMTRIDAPMYFKCLYKKLNYWPLPNVSYHANSVQFADRMHLAADKRVTISYWFLFVPVRHL